MPSLTLSPAQTLLAAFHRLSPARPLQSFLRVAHDRLRPVRLQPYRATYRLAEEQLLARGDIGMHQLATVSYEAGRGGIPTIVLGGFVPDASEQVFLLRHSFLRSGDIYYVNYPRCGFCLELLCAQLDDLVRDLTARVGPPVIFTVSFGGGVVLEWLRRARAKGNNPVLAGVVLVSPVACVEDVLAPGAAKPASLLGRALKPLLGTAPELAPPLVDKARAIFRRMFEAGAQNKAALRSLMTKLELDELRRRVSGTIRDIDDRGAHERVQALREMVPPPAYFAQSLLPLTRAPALVLYAENEDGVLDPAAPTRFALESALRAYFPAGRCQAVAASPGAAPVQHASLIFHAFEFLPPISGFYQRLRPAPTRVAA